MGITREPSFNQTTQPGLGNHGSARHVSSNPVRLDSSESSQGEREDFLDWVIQKNLRNFLAGQMAAKMAANAAKAPSPKSAIETTLPTNNTKGVGASPDMGCDQLIWDTDSSTGAEDADGDIVHGDPPHHLLEGAPPKGDGPVGPAIAEYNGEGFQKPESRENARSSQFETKDSENSAEEGKIVTPRRAFGRNENAISRHMAGSPTHIDSHGANHYQAFTTSPPPSEAPPKRYVRRPASVCRLNIPRELLINLHQDPRFDQYCHAWISRPDFCGRGDECYYAHMYPSGTVEEFGILTLDIDANGSALRGQDGGVDTRESRWSRYLLPGRQERTPGCYDRICKDFEKGVCRRGAECWYQHSTDPGVIRRRYGVFWKGRIDSKLEIIANANGRSTKPHRRSNHPGQSWACNNLNYNRAPLGRAALYLSRSEAINVSKNRQDYSRTIFPSVKNWEESSIANWNAAADRNAREYAGQQERLTCLSQEWQRRQTECSSTNPTLSTATPIKREEAKPSQLFYATDREALGPFMDEGLLMDDRDEPMGKQASGNPNEGILITFLC